MLNSTGSTTWQGRGVFRYEQVSEKRERRGCVRPACACMCACACALRVSHSISPFSVRGLASARQMWRTADGELVANEEEKIR